MDEFLVQTVAQCINSIHDLSPLWKKRKSCAEFPSDAPYHRALTIFYCHHTLETSRNTQSWQCCHFCITS